MSLLSLANRMVELYGRGSIKIMDYPEERKKIDIGDYYSCFTKFQEATGWRPVFSLDQTLERTLNYFKSYGKMYL